MNKRNAKTVPKTILALTAAFVAAAWSVPALPAKAFDAANASGFARDAMFADAFVADAAAWPAGQAEKQRARAVQDAPEWHDLHVWDSHHHRHHGFLRSTIFSEVAKLLGMTEVELAEALKHKTLAEIAAEKGISEKELLKQLKALYKRKIDEAVQEGRLDKEKAKRLKANIDEHLKHLIHRRLYEHRMRPVPDPDSLASLLGMTREELIGEWKKGKSLVEIAESRGIGKEELISRIKEELTPWIRSLVERKAKPAE